MLSLLWPLFLHAGKASDRVWPRGSVVPLLPSPGQLCPNPFPFSSSKERCRTEEERSAGKKQALQGGASERRYTNFYV